MLNCFHFHGICGFLRFTQCCHSFTNVSFVIAEMNHSCFFLLCNSVNWRIRCTTISQISSLFCEKVSHAHNILPMNKIEIWLAWYPDIINGILCCKKNPYITYSSLSIYISFYAPLWYIYDTLNSTCVYTVAMLNTKFQNSSVKVMKLSISNNTHGCIPIPNFIDKTWKNLVRNGTFKQDQPILAFSSRYNLHFSLMTMTNQSIWEYV